MADDDYVIQLTVQSAIDAIESIIKGAANTDLHTWYSEESRRLKVLPGNRVIKRSAMDYKWLAVAEEIKNNPQGRTINGEQFKKDVEQYIQYLHGYAKVLSNRGVAKKDNNYERTAQLFEDALAALKTIG